MRYEHSPHYPLHHLPNHHLPPHDPTAVDFRAFYPYTPNNVKHRRRTTSSQLKVLESVFRVDTKPNATLRNELAAQLEMTARGVQVWFQNRRAKEKNRASKVGKSGLSAPPALPTASSTDTTTSTPGSDNSPKEEEDGETASLPPPTPGEDSPEEQSRSDSPLNVPLDLPADSQANSPSPLLASPPKLHVFTDSVPRPSSTCSWRLSSPDETPPDSAVFSRHPLADIPPQRRDSLPADAFLHHSIHGPRAIDAWDPMARRRSVDTSLQRLVTNPYAQLARARNGALFGPRSPSQPQSGRHSLPKVASHLQPRRSILPHQPPSHYLDMRRASMDSRTLMSIRADGLSPSLSPRLVHPIRASLPDTSLYGAARRYVPQIPGPLPAPNFTFGAASVGSPSSPDDDRPQSPDLSSYSFPPKTRDDTADDDDVMSAVSYETLSRFGSVVSVATSESSVFSTTGYYDIGPTTTDPAPDLERRSSCGSAHGLFAPSMTAELDGVSSQPVSSPAPVTGDGYFDENPTCSVLTSETDSEPAHSRPNDVPSDSSFSSPASTASPNDNHMDQSSTTPVDVPVSNASELALALNNVTGKQAISGDALTPVGATDCTEQHLGHTPSHIQSPPPSIQQPLAQIQQTQAIQNLSRDPPPSLSSRIDISKASTVIAVTTTGKSLTPVELVQNIAGAHLRSEKLPNISKLKATKDDSSLLTEDLTNVISGAGDYAAQYTELMDGYGFGVPLAVAGDEVGQGQRQGAMAGCDTIVGLGVDVGVDEFAVASSTYGTGLGVSGIEMGQAYEVTFGS